MNDSYNSRMNLQSAVSYAVGAATTDVRLLLMEAAIHVVSNNQRIVSLTGFKGCIARMELFVV